MPSTRAPSSMRAFTLRALHDGAAARAAALVQAREEAVEHRRELLLDVGEREELLVQALTAALAVPLEPIELARAPGPLDHEPDGVSGPLRRVRHFGRNEEHLTLADRHIDRAAVLHGLEHHVALELVEELLPGVDVVVLAGIRAADHHDDEVAVAEDALVAHRRPQLRAVGLDPLLEIERLQGFHVPSMPFPLWYAQPWNRNALVVDLAAASGSGSITLKPAAGSAWPVRLAFRVTPGSVGLLSVRADQRLVIPITPAAGKPIELELAPRMYTSKTPQMLVSWGPNSPPVP